MYKTTSVFLIFITHRKRNDAIDRVGIIYRVGPVAFLRFIEKIVRHYEIILIYTSDFEIYIYRE